MRVVGNGNGNGSFLKSVATEQAESDVARTVVAFDDGDFDDISFFIKDEVTLFIAADLASPFPVTTPPGMISMVRTWSLFKCMTSFSSEKSAIVTELRPSCNRLS